MAGTPGSLPDQYFHTPVGQVVILISPTEGKGRTASRALCPRLCLPSPFCCTPSPQRATPSAPPIHDAPVHWPVVQCLPPSKLKTDNGHYNGISQSGVWTLGSSVEDGKQWRLVSIIGYLYSIIIDIQSPPPQPPTPSATWLWPASPAAGMADNLSRRMPGTRHTVNAHNKWHIRW